MLVGSAVLALLLICYISVFIDGISQHVVYRAAAEIDRDPVPEAYILEMFQILAKTIINFFEE